MSEPRERVGAAAAEDLPVLAELMADSPLMARYGITWAGGMRALESAWRAGDVLLTAREPDVPPFGLAWVRRIQRVSSGSTGTQRASRGLGVSAGPDFSGRQVRQDSARC